MWSGNITKIPYGWQLCDGTNGTPDLRDRFVVGAGSHYNINSIGGEDFHTLTVSEMPSHNHNGYSSMAGNHSHLTGSITDGTHIAGGGSFQFAFMNQYTAPAGEHNHIISITNKGDSQPHENRPPYYALAFIIKK